jgi:hypothetical protein
MFGRRGDCKQLFEVKKRSHPGRIKADFLEFPAPEHEQEREIMLRY